MSKKISRRSFIKKSIATAAMTGMSSILLTQQAPANVTLNKKPNILFILNDQERAHTEGVLCRPLSGPTAVGRHL